MHFAALIEEIADEAGDFLAGITDRATARGRIAERLVLDYHELTVADRAAVADGVMATLEADEFFGMEFVGDPFKDEPEPDRDE